MNWQLTHRNQLVYAALAMLWLAVMIWQWLEHQNVRRVNREAMVNRGRDITSTLGLVLRSQRRFGPFTAKERLEPALQELIRPGELDSIAILSPTGDLLASAGAALDVSKEFVLGPGLYWSGESLTLMNLVDLGTSEAAENPATAATIVLSEDMVPNPFSTDRNSFRRRGDWRDRDEPRESRGGEGREIGAPNDTESRAGAETEERPPRRERGFRPPFGRPPGMTQEEYQELIQKRGVHSFVIGLSASLMHTANARDLWLRAVIALLATAAAGVSALAWRNVARSAQLQIRLVKAGEMNAHLKEMNLAAAGLAHETRNPLNLIRGLAQMISRQPAAPEEIRERSKAIMDEADRVTAQLNEFINYSRPREVRRGAVSFNKVAGEIARALALDAEDKQIQIEVPDGELMIEADDPLLRQVLFNLLLNAVQAVPVGGHIALSAHALEGGQEAVIEIRDDGPGVPPAQRVEIFKPYVTMHQSGTGLGLAIVHQIVSAHGWEIDCSANEPHGAVFTIRHVKLIPPRKS
ncbi:MAG TPA: ATP-binding protein [Verrucomicrobiae bacterium]|nr:ATP-binding protein [Verrucomicrobiae bacterium]